MNKIIKLLLVTLISLILILTFLPIKAVSAYDFNGLVHNAVYVIKNKASGKFLNVNFGTDANGTNVIQWTRDGSIEQEWRYWENTGSGARVSMLYAMCSSNGTNRVLDVLRTGGSSSGSLQEGCNVDIWEEGDYDAQFWLIAPAGNGYYTIKLFSDPSLILTAYGTSNGSGAGTSPTSPGNVYVSSEIDGTDDYSLWEFIRIS